MSEVTIAVIGIVIAVIGIIIAIITARAAIKQNDLNRKAIQAQTFLTVVNTAREIRFSEGMDIIRDSSIRTTRLIGQKKKSKLNCT